MITVQDYDEDSVFVGTPSEHTTQIWTPVFPYQKDFP
jgi:hypothetical protein